MLNIPFPKSPGPAPLPPIRIPELFKLSPDKYADAVFDRVSQAKTVKPGLKEKLREFRAEHPEDITDIKQIGALHYGMIRVIDAFVIEPGIQMPWGVVVEP